MIKQCGLDFVQNVLLEVKYAPENDSEEEE
jgi:hypothetical protein